MLIRLADDQRFDPIESYACGTMAGIESILLVCNSQYVSFFIDNSLQERRRRVVARRYGRIDLCNALHEMRRYPLLKRIALLPHKAQVSSQSQLPYLAGQQRFQVHRYDT